MQDERNGAGGLPSLDETAAAESLDATTPSLSDRPAPTPGDRVGRYPLIEQIGQGAMGTVYAAYDPDLDRRIALKLLRGRAAGEEQQVRLQREAQAMARVSHPNVVHVYEVGRHEQQVFLAMEFIEGPTLSSWLDDDARGREDIVEVFMAAGRGLAAAHEAGLVHRDFKPDNVLVDASGRPRVLDFGLARAATELHAASGTAPADLPDAIADTIAETAGLSAMSTDLTRTGALLGTPAFMAAEQFAGLGATALSDQFAFCVALWTALAGERPFAGDTPVALAFAVQQGERRPMPASRSVPGHIRDALERGLALVPEERWPNMDALLEALAPAPPSSGRSLVVGIAVAAVFVVGLALAMWQTEASPDPCAEVTSPMDAAWTDEARAQVRAAIEESGSISSAWVASGVEQALDAYADQWRDTASSACRATHHDKSRSPHMFSLQQACLDRRLAAFGGLTQGLSAADIETVEQALQAVEGLPLVDRCADTEALLQAVPPPEDPRVAEQVSELRRRLARANSDAHLGRYVESERALEACREQAQTLDYLPIKAEIAAALARVRVSTGRTDEMERDARRAFELAVQATDHATARDAATQLADAVGTWGHRPEVAKAWLVIARTYLRVLPEPRTREQAQVLATEGNIHYIARDFEASRAAKLRAKELYETLGAEFDAAQMLNDVAVMEIMLGDLHAARRSLLEARQRQVEVLGDDHPAIGLIDQNLATVAVRAGDDEAALRLYLAAMDCAERNRGRAHPSYSVPLLSIAEVHLRQGHSEQARDEAQAARALLEGSNSERFNHARASAALARAELALGNTNQALAAADLAVETALAALGSDHSITNAARILRGLVRLERDELDQAQTDLTVALEASLKHDDSRNAGDAHFGLAKLHRRRGDLQQAQEFADAALEWFARVEVTPDPSDEIRRWRG